MGQVLEAVRNAGFTNGKFSQFPPSLDTRIDLSNIGELAPVKRSPIAVDNRIDLSNIGKLPAPKTPVPTRQYSPVNLPNPRAPLAPKLLNAANSLGNAANRVTGVLAVGAIAANYAQNPSVENGLRGALAVATVATAGVPYVNAAMFALNIGVAIWDASKGFKSPNNIKGGGLTTGFVGGQTEGVLYNVLFELIYQDETVSSWGNGRANPSDTAGRPTFNGAILGARYQQDQNATLIFLSTTSGEVSAGFIGRGFTAFSTTPPTGFRIVRVARADGQPEDVSQAPVIVINNDGSERPDLVQTVQDNLDQVQGKLDLLQSIASANNLDLQTIKDLVSLPRNNNNAQPLALAANPIAAIPKPLPVPSNAVDQLTTTGKPNLATVAPNRTPSPANNALVNRLNQQIKETQALASKQSQSQAQSQSVSLNERFKQSDCKFSCENLAKCFVDVNVLIFDGCDATNGTAKTKQITIQALPKDVEKTKATFKEFLDIRSKECSLADRVLTVPDYWQIRTGQRPQAIVLYREFLNGKFTDNYYSQSIPHYDKPKGSRPNLTQWSKGEYSAIYLCKDNSKVQVYASSEAEAKRVINEFTNSINPRMRGDIVKFGKRMGIKKTTVKPVRLDFFSTGQTKLSPDWSVSL